jgi:hypothetical protein
MECFESSIREILKADGLEDEKIRAINKMPGVYKPGLREISYDMHIFSVKFYSQKNP